ncbi:MAG: S-layer homology domain-containing protein [Bacteroides sp.]|nr:S-layer homology domain-containing protein [Bacteroides sp.]
MTAAMFCAQALNIARNYKTSYMLGPWGWPANDKMITRATTNGSNAQTNKSWLSYANAIKGKGFLFDCVGLIKGILWGWNGDLSRTYGGAGYACNGVPDCDAKKMIDSCREVSTDFSGIVPGEAVWMDGHIGIYVGGGVVVESTPRWNWGVQESTCLNVAGKQLPGTVGSRTWTKHGKLPWVDYSAAKEIDEEDDDMLTYEQWKEYMDRYRQELRADHDQCWAEGELAAAVAAGITNGARPHDFVTREEAAIMALRSKD